MFSFPRCVSAFSALSGPTRCGFRDVTAVKSTTHATVNVNDMGRCIVHPNAVWLRHRKGSEVLDLRWERPDKQNAIDVKQDKVELSSIGESRISLIVVYSNPLFLASSNPNFIRVESAFDCEF